MFSFGSMPIASTPVLDRLRIQLPVGGVSGPAPGQASPTKMLPSYVTYFQRRTLWCWAAVAMSIARYYNSESSVTQCWIANRTLDRSDCCFDGPDTEPCNVQAALSTALRAVGHYESQQDPDVAEVRRQIKQQRPVGIFIRWTPTDGHFAAICGYGDSPLGTEFVVADPRYGNRSVHASELLEGRYRGAGTWTDLYLTSP
jgi:hypothetical protein